MSSSLDQPNSEQSPESNKAGIDPDSFSSTAEFQVAINTIDAAIALLLSTDQVLAKRAAVDKARKFFVERLQELKETIENHPKREVLAQKEAQLALQQTIERQGNMIKSDEQLLGRLDNIIGDTEAYTNKEKFCKTFLDRLYQSGSFEHKNLYYGDYERYGAAKCIVATIKMEKEWGGYIVILRNNVDFKKKTLELGKLSIQHTHKKDPIVPTIQLCPEYIQSRSVY